MLLKLTLSGCWIALLLMYLSLGSYRVEHILQSMLGLLDIFLALAVPVGFAHSIGLSVKDKHISVKGALFSMGFLLIFTLSQLMHSGVSRAAIDALAMTQHPPIEEKIARLVDRALFDSQEVERSQAAALLYMISGVKTMYKVQDQSYIVYRPSEEEQEEEATWRNSNSQVVAMKLQLQEQLQALNNRTLFHLSSFFCLFSITLLLQIRKAKKQAGERLP